MCSLYSCQRFIFRRGGEKVPCVESRIVTLSRCQHFFLGSMDNNVEGSPSGASRILQLPTYLCCYVADKLPEKNNQRRHRGEASPDSGRVYLQHLSRTSGPHPRNSPVLRESIGPRPFRGKRSFLINDTSEIVDQ